MYESLSGVYLKNLVQTCFACPSQWEGVDAYGHHVYIRYRFGSLTVSLDDTIVFMRTCGDDLDGVMSTEEMLDMTAMSMVDFDGLVA